MTLPTLAEEGLSLHVLNWDFPSQYVQSTQTYAGGLLLAIPSGFLAPSALVAAQGVADNSLLGPSESVHFPMCVLDEQGEEQSLDMEVPVLLIDVGEEAAALLQEEYTEETEAAGIFPYVPTQPDALPMAEATLTAARLWLSEVDFQRMAFYSAAEGPDEALGSEDVPAKPAMPPKQKANAKAKRVTTAQLGPVISQQLSDMQRKQQEFDGRLASQPLPQTLPLHQQPFAGPASASRVKPEPLAGHTAALPPARRLWRS